MSIRLRLTLIYSAILAVALIIFSSALYFTVSGVTLAVVEQTLNAEWKRLVASRDFSIDKIGYYSTKFTAPQTYIQTMWLNGNVADQSANLEGYTLPISDAGWKACTEGEEATEIVDTDDGRLLVYSKSVPPESGKKGVLQVARSLVEYDASLDTLRGILISGSLIATLTTFGVGWVLASASLRPIDRITQTAQAIGSERNFSRRVSYTGPDDEVGRLTRTFNTMLTELQSTYSQMEETLFTQRRFVADASHELRTPLTTIRGNIGLLERDPPISNEDRIAVLADTVEECDRLIRLVNNLLVLARADSSLALKQEPVAIKPLIDDVCRQAALLADGRTIACSNSLDVSIQGDRDALRQVLLILIDNAIKYTPVRGTVTITTDTVDHSVMINVRDTGSGIAPSVLPHIFERFYRVETSRTSKGTGLGLSIAKELVEAQGGQISVESEEGKGSAFILKLPRIL
jgi:two-component system, OmpR family, sensor kinase